MTDNFIQQLNQILKEMESHFKSTSYSSYDLCDIKAIPFFLRYYNTFSRKSFGKYFLFPVEIILQNFPGILRKLFRIKPQAFAQSHALLIRASILLWKQSGISEYQEEADNLLQWVLGQKSGMTRHASWGQPYDWFSKDIIPAHTPRTTVSSQILHMLCDMYLINKKEEQLILIKDLSQFFLSEMTRSVDTATEICYSYTLVDQYKVHNANMMASSALFRSGMILQDKEILSVAEKCLNYSVNRQNPDGSWYYYELPEGKASKIDNYHTGYVLESLSVIRHIQGSDFNYEEEFMKGSEYFLKNFFENGHIPKMTPSSVYPIDIQSCAQSIITLIELARNKPEYREKAEAVLNYTINHFYSRKGWFYYRIGKRGGIHKTSYIRWGDAWMYLAIVRFLTFEQYD